MADIDLTEAIDAAAAVQYCIDYSPEWSDETDETVKDGYRDAVRESVTAAAPLIAAQVRAQIAEDIDEAARRPVLTTVFDATSILYGFRAAARIARGES